MKNIVIVGNYGSTNLGDELILLGLLKAIFDQNPEVSVTIPSALPEETERVTRFYFSEKTVKAVPRIPFGFRSLKKASMATLKAFQEADSVILGGGGLFADDESILTCPFWYIQCLPALRYKKPLMIYGIGIGPLRGRLGKYILKKLVEKAKSVSVRDKTSKEQIEKICSGKEVQIVSDPIFFLDESFFGRALSEEPTFELPKKPYVTLSLRKYRGWNENLYKIFAQMIDFIVSEFGLHICFLPFQTYPISDLEILNKIIVHVKYKDHIFYSKSGSKNILQNLTMAFRAIKNSRCMLGMRLHSNLFSSIMGIPFLPILYSQKAKAFIAAYAPKLEELALSFPLAYEEGSSKIKTFLDNTLSLGKIYSTPKTDISQFKLQIS